MNCMFKVTSPYKKPDGTPDGVIGEYNTLQEARKAALDFHYKNHATWVFIPDMYKITEE